MEEMPEIGDVVEWGEPIYSYAPNQPRTLVCDASRGEVLTAYSNGSVRVQPENGDKPVKLFRGAYIILSKAG